LSNKLLNTFFVLIVLFISLIVLAAALGWLVPINIFLEVLEQRDPRLVIAAVSLLISVLAFYTLTLLFKKKPIKKHTLIDTTEFGEIHITLNAIENFISRSASTIREIKEVKPQIKMLPEGVALLLRVSINPDTNVPQVTKDLQDKVANYLKEYGGMDALEIEVVVDKIAQSIKSRVD
jgi:uncharacterized alkaline shock family protein YloU